MSAGRAAPRSRSARTDAPSGRVPEAGNAAGGDATKAGAFGRAELRQRVHQALDLGGADAAAGTRRDLDELAAALNLPRALGRVRVTLTNYEQTVDMPATRAVELAYRLGRALAAAEVVDVDAEASVRGAASGTSGVRRG